MLLHDCRADAHVEALSSGTGKMSRSVRGCAWIRTAPSKTHGASFVSGASRPRLRRDLPRAGEDVFHVIQRARGIVELLLSEGSSTAKQQSCRDVNGPSASILHRPPLGRCWPIPIASTKR